MVYFRFSTHTHVLIFLVTFFEYSEKPLINFDIVAKRILNTFNGLLTTDDFNSYYWYELRQLCWAYLLREAKEFAEKYPEAKIQYERLKALYAKAKITQEIQDTSKYDTLKSELEDIARCYHPMDGCRIMYGKINNRTNLWLRAVKYPTAQLTNNRAERNLRKVVLHRNRIGCIRNEKGEAFVNNFLTCTSTWQIQGKNTYEKLLRYSQLT
ncbi:transposase [Candidatus Woesearchaeota archaeon]|nr:transposase [Candidatus Woesearchaeota archaeon]